jgi:hypothetical protein
MTLVLADRVQETCSAPGTGAVTLLGAVTGYQTFSSAIGNGNTCYYTIADQSGANWEVGIGTYASSGNTLTRTTVVSSSNSGSVVNFSSGTQNVFVTYPAEFAALGGGAQGILVNKDTITSSYTIASGTNGFSVGPINIASGVSVSVASGQRWVVI